VACILSATALCVLNAPTKYLPAGIEGLITKGKFHSEGSKGEADRRSNIAPIQMP
jgi:hypothetical protein